MPYTIKQLADLAGVSVRTLHYYDEVGLLLPNRTKGNGYRMYEDKELLLLQQILFFRELDFPITDIKKIITAKDFDMKVALEDQRKIIELKKKRLKKLTDTINKTINTLNKKTTMNDEELYNGLSTEEIEKYTEEAKKKWGHTLAWKQSQERYARLSKEEKQKIQKDSDELMKKIASSMTEDVRSEKVQKLITEHYANLSYFYEPSLDIYRGLAEMYIADSRFTAYYEKYATGLAQFMHDAMIAFCEAHKR